MSHLADESEVLTWVEQVAEFFARQDGLPPITGRILGWLMVCEQAEQSAADIARAIRASRASMTGNIRALVSVGLIRRRTQAGDRTAYYRIDDDAWETTVRRRIQGMIEFQRITERGMTMLGPDNPRSSRLRAAHDVYQWMGILLADADKSTSEHSSKGYRRS